MPLIRDTPPEELSPYILQHRDNPVDWYLWGQEAFDRADLRDRPIFVSIGYSACHWCHVMAHESFEDPAVAALLNEAFVSIKVDREERPDVDAVYMEAVQALTGSGGWPMSVFLMPDRRPFFGGTYFPPDDRRGTPSFTTVLGALTDVWDNRRHEVEAQASELSAAIASRSSIPRSATATSLFADREGEGPDLLTPAVEEMARRFDPEWGDSARPPSSPSRHWSTWPCGSRNAGRGTRAAPGPSRWPPPRSTPWPPEGSTTTWAVASPGTQPTATGSSPTSRRCSTTRPGCCGPTCTAGRSPGGTTT